MYLNLLIVVVEKGVQVIVNDSNCKLDAFTDYQLQGIEKMCS